MKRTSSLNRWSRIGRVIAVSGVLGMLLSCSPEWPAYRHNVMRTGNQLKASALSNPARVPSLAIRWSWLVPDGPKGFFASPIVYNDRVYVGNGNGRFYALNAGTGTLLWEYPALPAPALISSFQCNPSSFGIASSAIIASVGGRDAVIFAAPDPSLSPGYGSGRLFALDAATGAVIWKSPSLASLTGTTWSSTTELHEQIGYSSPLVYDGKVYVGIGDHCDNPIQNGAVRAVDLATGAIVGGFTYKSTGTRGGGVWTTAATDLVDLYITTGNSKCWAGGCQSEPTPNNALSMLRLDKATGNIVWKFQPVPFALDDDPDWSAGATVMSTSCGLMIASVQKDGWAYAVNPGNGTPGALSVRWQFPPTGYPFAAGSGLTHGDDDYKKPGAAWNDVLLIVTAGRARPAGVTVGYGKLHALNACAAPAERVRWILDVPHTTAGSGYSLGAPTVTGGIVYIGTDQGWVIAIADPSVFPATGWRCDDVRYSVSNCVSAGNHLVPTPAVLAQVQVNGGMWNEPALAKGRVFVATKNGYVHMLSP